MIRITKRQLFTNFSHAALDAFYDGGNFPYEEMRDLAQSTGEAYETLVRRLFRDGFTMMLMADRHMDVETTYAINPLNVIVVVDDIPADTPLAEGKALFHVVLEDCQW